MPALAQALGLRQFAEVLVVFGVGACAFVAQPHILDELNRLNSLDHLGAEPVLETRPQGHMMQVAE